MKHKKHEIVLDFDETLFYTSRETKVFLNQYFGIQIPTDSQEYMCGHSIHQLVMQFLPSEHKLSEGKLYEILGREFLASTVWHENISPVPGVLEIVPELAQKYKLHVATARQYSSKPVVEMLIDKFLPGLISSTHFVYKHLGNKKFTSIPKKDFIQTLKNPIAYIDDNPIETRDVGDALPCVILFDPYGYHVETNSGAHHHISHWKEIKSLLL
jgi:hypothetical protein